MTEDPWRVGRHYGIHVYAGDRPVATFHDAENALIAVRAVNASPAVSAMRLGRAHAFEEVARWAESILPGSYDDEQILAAVVDHCRREAGGVREAIAWHEPLRAGITVDTTTEEKS